jgi:hypothetical protein
MCKWNIGKFDSALSGVTCYLWWVFKVVSATFQQFFYPSFSFVPPLLKHFLTFASPVFLTFLCPKL